MKKTLRASKRFSDRMRKVRSALCVGLDPDVAMIPKELRSKRDPLFAFNKRIILATAQFACAFKPNFAFYEAYGAHGIEQLQRTCEFLHDRFPEIPIILDAKRADIDSTNGGTVAFAFDHLNVDAITLNPYLGKEALQPFLSRKNKVCIILCHTSNPGAGEFQEAMVKLKASNKVEPLYLHVARTVARNWNANNNCMLVVGATYPKGLAKVREIVGEMTLLVPGVGSQGGDLKAVMKYGQNSTETGLIVNVSRAIASLIDSDRMTNAASKYVGTH